MSTTQDVTRKPRAQHIDVTRGLAILLIVFGHNSAVPMTVSSPLFSVLMPLFFLLSGMFFRPNVRFLPLVFARTQSLLQPYAVTAMLVLIPLTIFTGVRVDQYLRGIIYGSGPLIVEVVPLWFLPALYLTTLAAWALLSSGARWGIGQGTGIASRLVVLTILLAVGIAAMRISHELPLETIAFGVLGRHSPPGLPFSLDLVPVSLFYFLVGYWWRKPIIDGRYRFWVTASGLLLALGFYVAADATVSFYGRYYGNAVAATLASAVGCYAVLGIGTLLSASPGLARLLSYFGRSTLVLLCFHVPAQKYLYQALVGTISLPVAWQTALAGVGSWILVVLLCVLIERLLNRSRVGSIVFYGQDKSRADGKASAGRSSVGPPELSAPESP